MASASAPEHAIPALPPAIPTGMEAALGVPLAPALAGETAISEALAVQASDLELENDTAIQATEDAGLTAGLEAAAEDHRAMKMPDFWQAVANENNLASIAQARSVVGTALRLATTQARDHGSFRMGSYVKFTRVKRGSQASSVDLTPLAKVQKYSQ